MDVENILENSFGPSISNWESPEIVDLVIKTAPSLQKHFETMPLSLIPNKLIMVVFSLIRTQ